MEATNSNHLWMLSSCALFAGLASAQSLEDELGELASEAVSVFTSVTSEVVSMWTELTSIVANAPASTNPAASSATATSASSLASEPSSIASASSSIASQSAVISSASSSFSSALSSLSSSSQSASARASASSALSSSVSSALSSLSSSLGSTSSPTSSHSSARSTGSSSSRGPSSSSATSQVAASSPNGDSNLSSSHHSHPNVAGIVVGTVVGALVLGLLILLALLCLRRRRRRRRRRTGVSPTDAEVESWRNTHEDEYAFLGPGTQRATAGHDNVMAAAAVPAMREGSMHNRHHNPFVPAPPPPRRVAANSRPGFADGTVPGQMPFDAVAVGASGVHPAYRGDPAAAARDQHHHGLGKDIAVGAGGALLGAAAMKHHNDKDRRKESIEMPADTPRRHSIQRKPVGAAVPNMNEDTSAESTLLNPRQSLDQQDSGYKSDIVSPTSPTGPAELPSPSYDRGAGGDNEPLLGGRGEKAAGLFALAASANRRNHDRNNNNNNNNNNSASRPVLQRASSSDYEDVPIAMAAGPSSNRPSYQSYQPQDSPTLATSASSSYPTTRSSSAPDVPARSPARASFGPDTPPSDASSDSLNTSAAPSSRRRSASVEAAEAAMEREEAADHVSDTLIPAMWRRSAEGGARMPPKGVSYHDFKPVRRDVSTGYNNSGGSSSNYNAAPSSSSTTGQRRLSDRSGAYAQLTGQQQANAFAGSLRDTRRVSLSELIEEEKRLEAARQRRRSSSSRGSSSALASPWHSGAATPTEAYEGRGYGVGQAL